MEEKLDNKFSNLLNDVEFAVSSIRDGSTTIDEGRYIPNSALAIETASNLIKLSAILKCLEFKEEENYESSTTN